MTSNFIYQVDDKDYRVEIIYKRIRNIHYRFNGEYFIISCPKSVSMKMIKSGLDKYAKKLIERNVQTAAVGENYIYLFGQKYDLSFPGQLIIDETTLSFKTMPELDKKLKKLFHTYVSKRTHYYETIMKCPHYLVKVRQMKSRYGSNNRPKRVITYSLVLLHYSKEIIDSVIIHEIAHHFVYDHSAKFYKVVYKYCPNYDILRKKLINAELN